MTKELTALLFFLWTAPARAEAPVLVEDAIATVNGRAIMLSEYRKEIASTTAYLRRTNPGALDDPSVMRKVRESTLEELITRELLVEAARRAGLTATERDVDDAVEEIKDRFKEDPKTGLELGAAQAETAFNDQLKADGVDYAEYRQSLTSDIVARKIIARNVTGKMIPPSSAETRAFFGKIQAYLASKSTAAPAGLDAEDAAALRQAALQVKALSSDAVRVERILVRVSAPATGNEIKRALKTAQALKKRIDDGEDFEAVARAESEDPESAARGGDIGYVVRGISDPEIEKETFSLPVDLVSDPILTEIGYNIVRVTEKRAAKPPDYARFESDLRTFLTGLAQRKELRSYLKELHDRAVIERHLPPSP